MEIPDINLFIMKSSQNKKRRNSSFSVWKHNHEILKIFLFGERETQLRGTPLNDSFTSLNLKHKERSN